MPDIREAIEAAFPEVEPQQDAAPVTESAPPEQLAEPAAEPQPVAERPRDEHGRFAPKQEAAAQESKPVETQPAVEAPAPPKSWRKDYHEHWSKLDPSLQQYMHEREEQFYRGVGTYKQQAEVAQQFMEAARPYEAVFRANGVTPVQAFQALANADYTLRTADPATKANMFAQLAQQYGVDLGQVANPPQVDPAMQQINGTVQQLQQALRQQQQMYEDLQRSMLEPQIQQHATKPHFDELRPTMAQLLQSGLAQTLEDAYDKALRMTPHWEEQQAQQRQAQEQQRLQEAAQVAARAKARAVQVHGSPSTALPETKRDLRSVLEGAFNEHLR
jgi:hypothetical protein